MAKIRLTPSKPPRKLKLKKLPRGKGSGGGAPRFEFNPDVAQFICGQISQGVGLREICKLKNIPNVCVVFRWLREHPNFAKDYASAREEQGDLFAEKIAEVAAASNSAKAAGDRVKIDAYKWLAGKRKPKVYGDLTRLRVGGDEDAPPVRMEVELEFVEADEGKPKSKGK